MARNLQWLEFTFHGRDIVEGLAFVQAAEGDQRLDHRAHGFGASRAVLGGPLVDLRKERWWHAYRHWDRADRRSTARFSDINN